MFLSKDLAMDDNKNHSPPPPCAADGGEKQVCYYYDDHISYFDYGEEHLMVPNRVAMTHGLLDAYGLLDDMDHLHVSPATKEDLKVAHTEEYLDLLSSLTPSNYEHDHKKKKSAERHHLGRCSTHDNPVIVDLWDYCSRYAGGSLAAARALATGKYKVAINWAGGMHHASEGKASGFCYVNDVVVAIKALLDRFGRVLYVDIDAHHGDGVQDAFVEEARVMTVSFHQYEGKNFFTYTGDVTLNVPLEAGTGDVRYHKLFEPIMKRVMEVFRPDAAVVLQCGADSLAGDRITGLELSIRGHARCVRFLRSYDVPLLLLGGGGYTINHVACCWCYEVHILDQHDMPLNKIPKLHISNAILCNQSHEFQTAVVIGKEIPDDIPDHGQYEYYKTQGYKLHYYHEAHSGSSNGQTAKMSKVKKTVMEHLDNLSALMAAPSEHPDVEPAQAVNIDEDALVNRLPRGEDPMQRLHRLCCGVELNEFLIDLGPQKQVKRNKVDHELKC